MSPPVWHPPSAVAEVASSAEFAVDVTASVASLAGHSSVVIVGVTSLADPVCVATAGVAFREECGDSVMILSGSICDSDDYFDYDDPGDFDSRWRTLPVM